MDMGRWTEWLSQHVRTPPTMCVGAGYAAEHAFHTRARFITASFAHARTQMGREFMEDALTESGSIHQPLDTPDAPALIMASFAHTHTQAGGEVMEDGLRKDGGIHRPFDALDAPASHEGLIPASMPVSGAPLPDGNVGSGLQAALELGLRGKGGSVEEGNDNVKEAVRASPGPLGEGMVVVAQAGGEHVRLGNARVSGWRWQMPPPQPLPRTRPAGCHVMASGGAGACMHGQPVQFG